MPDILKEKGEDRFDPRRSELRLVSEPDGKFRIESPDGATVSPENRGWTIRRASGGEAPGFVLEEDRPGGPREVGRTGRGSGPGLETAGLYLADGRVFRVVPRTGPEACYELHGWEVRGAYWIARYRGDRWILTATAAGTRLDGAEEILLLFAAEILAASNGY